ncbi:MAG: heme exporter protein CcmD [Flavobacteriales bacterium]
MKEKLFIALLCMLMLIAMHGSAEAKHPRKSKKGQPQLKIDWNNTDTLNQIIQTSMAGGDARVGLRVVDSLIARTLNQGIYPLQELLSKVKLLSRLGKKQEALALLNQQRDYELNQPVEIDHVCEQYIGYYQGIGQTDSALSISQLLNRRLNMKIDKVVHDKNYEAHLSGKMKEDLSRSQQLTQNRDKQLQMFIWISCGVMALLMGLLVWLMASKRKQKHNQQKLQSQMQHTQTQIEKAFEEEERISTEIKKMKEQVARIDAERNMMKQNMAASTSETLPLLKSQLEAIIRENKEAIPVEKYMQLQNTITRFNKQMRDVAGSE